ncbi:hypothetical protein A2450_02500 [candidate division WWE3 bacterium RIFOXYC2_FULL_40_11]|nr:MAG: hypothetical protein A2450_02500 [candidate division WWE3 bacterium RIFOXYC2_FULL_40_11]
MADVSLPFVTCDEAFSHPSLENKYKGELVQIDTPAGLIYVDGSGEVVLPRAMEVTLWDPKLQVGLATFVTTYFKIHRLLMLTIKIDGDNQALVFRIK